MPLPCLDSWEPEWCCALPDHDDHPDLDVEDLIDRAVEAAAEVLHQLTGQRFGLCEITLRPCRRDCWDDLWGPRGWHEWIPGTEGLWPRPALIGGHWFNLVCGGCDGGCSCRPLSEAALPGPVHRITEVRLDGEVLVEDVDWRLDNGRLLVRLGGQWPICQRMDLPDTEPGTWSVTAEFGEPLPQIGRLALGELACQFIQACIPGGKCTLGPPIQQLVRQGITMELLDPNMVFANGRIGLPRSDLFISAYNPHRLTAPPAVYDVDGASWRHTGRQVGS